MFEFLFKFSPVVYREGSWSFRYLPSWFWLAGALALVVVLAYLAYRKQAAPIGVSLRSTLFILKLLAILLILASLLEPYISVSTIVPQKSAVLVLVDDSQSMRVQDGPEHKSRKAAVVDWLGTREAEGMLARLKQNFRVHMYRFSDAAAPLQDASELTASGRSTDLYSALEFAEKESHEYPLSGVILVTDGAHVRSGVADEARLQKDPLQAAALVKSAGIPVFPVGVGSRIQTEVQLARVATSPSATEDDFIELSATVHARGTAGKTVTFQLLEEGRLVATKVVTLSGPYTRTSIAFKPSRKGFLEYEARVKPLKDELIVSNNSKKFLIHHQNRIARILYIEELHPFDYKFIRRALDLDDNINLVSMVRTGPDKFLRQGIRDQRELADGFPRSRRELFAYQAVIIGSIEAKFFSPQQLDLLKAFVSERGGGLLMLGGPKSFAAGGWQETPVAEVLPVSLRPSTGLSVAAQQIQYGPFKLRLTPEGWRSPLLQLSQDAQQNREMWERLPQLLSYNPLGPPKPAASVLAVHPLSQEKKEKIILATQRYGNGKTMVFATSTSWRWQMGLPSEDQSHEHIWRQIARWLALNSPDPVSVTFEKSDFQPGETVPVSVTALDSAFKPILDAQISVQVKAPFDPDAAAAQGNAAVGDPPTASSHSVALIPVLDRPGQYRGEFVPQDEGLYEVEVLAHMPDGKYIGGASSAFLVTQEHLEFTRPDLQEKLLRRIATVTGGKYLHLSDAENLADELSVTETTFSKIVDRDIWDAPFLYGLILVLLSIEWFTRRSKGLS